MRLSRPGSLVILPLVLASCGGGGDTVGPGAEDATSGGTTSGAAPPAEAGGAATVDMTDDLQFVPKGLTVKAGQRVVWDNVGNIAHTVTADPAEASDPSNASMPAGAKEWDSGLIERGKTFERKLTKPGTYRYFCIPHEGAGMTGTIVVR